jgi:hypothetical protein
MVARDAAIASANRLVVGNLVSRDKEGAFTAEKIGDYIDVTVPPAVTDASEFTSSTSASDQTETKVRLQLKKHFYKRIDLTSKQKSLELSDFTRLVTVPAITGIMSSVDKYILRKMQAFRKNLTGTVGNRPSTLAHIAAATKVMTDNWVPNSGRIALVDTTVQQSLSQIAQFMSVDYGPDAAEMLRNGSLGTRLGFGFVVNPNSGAFVRSDVANSIAGTVLTNGTPAVGATEIPIDGITSTTGTIYAGTVVTLAGDTTRYVLLEDATIAANATTLVVSPALAAAPGDGAAVTFEAAGYSNLVYHPSAVAAAIVAPAPLAVNSSVQTFNGVSIRVSMDSSITSLSDSIVYDVFVGANVIQPDGGALFCG